MELRPYQKDVIDQINLHLDNGIKRIMTCSPTASGKTIIFTFLAKQFQSKRILVITHRKELLTQSGNVFTKFGIIPHSLTANTKTVPEGDVVVSMVETLYRRLENKVEYQLFMSSIDIIIIDEGHIGNFDKTFKHITNQTVLGFSATPYRRSPQKPLSNYYQEIVQGPQVKELIKLGFLSKSLVFGRKLDMTNIGTRGGEYRAEDQEAEFDAQQMYSSVVSHYKKLIPGKKNIIFAPTVNSSKTLVAMFKAEGIDAAHVDGETPKAEREEIFEAFKNGTPNILSNVNIATMGLDIPDIEAVTLFMATKSIIRYLQGIGRGARIAEGKRLFYILDYGSNTSRLGFYEDERNWSLELDQTRFRKEPLTTKTCPVCETILPIRTRICPNCEHLFAQEQMREVIREELEVELVAINSYPDILDYIEGKSFLELDIIRELKGYSKGWLLHQLNTEEELKQYAEFMKYKEGWLWYAIKRFEPRTTEQRKEEFNNWKNRNDGT